MSDRVIGTLVISTIILHILARRMLTLELNKMYEHADKAH